MVKFENIGNGWVQIDGNSAFNLHTLKKIKKENFSFLEEKHNGNHCGIVFAPQKPEKDRDGDLIKEYFISTYKKDEAKQCDADYELLLLALKEPKDLSKASEK